MRERPGESVRLPAIVHIYLLVELRDLTFHAPTGEFGEIAPVRHRRLGASGGHPQLLPDALGDPTGGARYLIRRKMTGKGAGGGGAPSGPSEPSQESRPDTTQVSTQGAVTVIDDPLDLDPVAFTNMSVDHEGNSPQKRGRQQEQQGTPPTRGPGTPWPRCTTKSRKWRRV